MKSQYINIYLLIFSILSTINVAYLAAVIEVSTPGELYKAMQSAKAGQIISIAPGIYDFTTYDGAHKFYGTAEGTSNSPITLTANDPYDPPILQGSTLNDDYVLHITGDYWIIENVKVAYAQKGIVLDNSNYSIIRNVEVYSTGAEAIAIRDGSSHCLIKNCYIHNTGLVSPAYGEGIYIGSSESTSQYDHKCDENIIQGCIFRDISAEHIDIKEYTTGQEVFGCTFYGDGMSGENYAGSFIDIAGNDVFIHDNVGYRNKNKNIVAAFEVHKIVEEWGDEHVFLNNVLYMDRPYGEVDTERRMYVVDGWGSEFAVRDNKVDYGDGLIDANSGEFYNSDLVIYLK